jgi:hypothetical protein
MTARTGTVDFDNVWMKYGTPPLPQPYSPGNPKGEKPGSRLIFTGMESWIDRFTACTCGGWEAMGGGQRGTTKSSAAESHRFPETTRLIGKLLDLGEAAVRKVFIFRPNIVYTPKKKKNEN